MEMQYLPLGVQCVDVLRHQIDVAHYLLGIFEHLGVDGLDNVGLLPPILPDKIHPIGLVDVPAFDFLPGSHLPLNLKCVTYFL